MGKKKGRKDRPLGGLAEALLKAGVVDEAAANKANREQRRQDRALGAEGRARRGSEGGWGGRRDRAALCEIKTAFWLASYFGQACIGVPGSWLFSCAFAGGRRGLRGDSVFRATVSAKGIPDGTVAGVRVRGEMSGPSENEEAGPW